MTLLQLTYFLAAVRHGSFSAAAEALDIAQPSLSEQVKRLEQELGVVLFIRTNRRLVLTEAGEVFLPRAQQALDAAADAADSVRGIRTLSGGTVAIGTFSSAHPLFLANAIAEFRARHPEVSVRVVGLNSSEVAEAVRDGQLEVGLVGLPIDDRGLDVGPVAWEAEAVYFTSERSKARVPITTIGLSTAPLILSEARWGAADPTRRQLQDRAQHAGVSIRPIVEVESNALALELAVRGLGDTIMSWPLAFSLGYANRLYWTSLEPPLVETFAFVTRRGVRPSPAAQVLVELARDHLQRIPEPSAAT